MKELYVDEFGQYNIICKKRFEITGQFEEKIIEKVFNFAYDMTFGDVGKHRDHRSGGNAKRKNGEIFINAFQGKLAEFGIYEYLKKKGITTDEPDLNAYRLGTWDDFDLEIGNKHLNIKSTKPFGNLLLLETADWNKKGEYLPNLNNSATTRYDYFVLTRVGYKSKPWTNDGETLMKANKMLWSNEINRENLKNIIIGQLWCCDIPGYISIDELINEVITRNQILPQGAQLGNMKVRMDAENYYIQAGDMHSIDELINEIR